MKPTMYAAIYEIKVPGYFDARGAEWTGEIRITAETEADGSPVTTLTGAVDQAALIGLLRQLYALGLPLISVIWIGEGSQ